MVPGVPPALALVAGPSMDAPAVANVGTRLLTGERWSGLLARPGRLVPSSAVDWP